MIVAEYRSPLPVAAFTSTAATFTGTGGFSACLACGFNTATDAAAINKSTVLATTTFNRFFFICLLRSLFRNLLWPSNKPAAPVDIDGLHRLAWPAFAARRKVA